MTLSYKAKNGRTYYLCYEILRGGQRVYDLRRKVGRHTADALPPGYEIVDNGNFVSLRLTKSPAAAPAHVAQPRPRKKPTAAPERQKESSQPPVRREPHKKYGPSYILGCDESGCIGNIEVDCGGPWLVPPDPSPVAFCRICSSKFPSMTAAREHMRLAHPQGEQTKSQIPRRVEKLKAAITSGMVTSCHFCQERVLRAELKSHIKQHHPDRLKKVKTPRSHEMVCELCGAVIKKKNAARHHQRVHSSKPPTQQPTKTVQQNRTLTTCPECHVQVRSDRLVVHLRKVHETGQGGDELSARLPCHAHGRAITKSDRQKLESLRQSLDEREDGSKYWGFMSRESGQFGSFPLFDDYGDESEP